MGASDEFKKIINGLAGMAGWLKENAGLIVGLVKSIGSLLLVLTAYRLRLVAIAAAQYVAVAAFGVTRVGVDKMSASMLRSAMAVNTATRSWKAFGAAMKAHWVGIVLTIITATVTAMISFGNNCQNYSNPMGFHRSTKGFP